MGSKKKLTVISPSYYPAMIFGGPGVAVKTFVEVLRHSTTVPVVTVKSGLSEDEANALVADSNLQLLQYFGAPVSKGDLNRLFADIKSMFEAISESDYVYFRAIWNPLTYLGVLICLLTRRRYIIAATGKIVALQNQLIAKKRPLLKRLADIFITYPMLRLAYRIHSTGSLETASIRTFLGAQTPIIELPTAVPFDFWDLANREKNHDEQLVQACTVSRLHPIKRLELSLTVAFSISKLLDKRVHLKVVGGADDELYERQIKLFASELSLREPRKLTIEFCGQKGREDVKEILFRSRYFIQMSESEGFSNSLLEALAAKTLPFVSRGCNVDPKIAGSCVIIDAAENQDIENHLQASMESILELDADPTRLKPIWESFGENTIARTYADAIAELR